MTKTLTFTCALIAGLTSFIVGGSEEVGTPSTVSFGIVPQQSASKLARLWAPILAHISKESGVQIIFATAKDIPTFEERLRKGKYDLAYMNPYHYTIFHQNPGYRAFAKAKGKTINGILVVRKGGGVTNISELQGASLAFPAPAAFAASILTRTYLRNQGIEFTPKYVESHDSVYRTVAKGLYPAGGGILRTLQNMSQDVGRELEILWQSPGYTPHAFAAHPRLDTNLMRSIQKIMVEMGYTEQGERLLAAINFKDIEAADDADWDDVRALNIKQLLSQ